MTIPITGHEDDGPAACVGRFILASVAGDETATRAELLPDSLALAEGVPSPPPMTAVVLETPVPGEDRILIPARFMQQDGSEQRFVFAVRRIEERWGVDLQASVQATFGMDPEALLGSLMEQAVEPLKEVVGAMGSAFEAMGNAMSGAGGSEPDGSPARRITGDELLGEPLVELGEVALEVTSLTWQRRVERDGNDGSLGGDSSVSVKCRLGVAEAWTVMACLGVDLERAEGNDGGDLLPEPCEGLGSESYASWERERGEYGVSLTLGSPGPGFTGLSALAGRIRLRIEGGEMLEVVLGPVGGRFGTSLPIAALGLELALARDEEGRIQLTGPYDCFDRFADIDLIETDGSVVSSGYNGYGDGETSRRTYDGGLSDEGSIRLRFRAQVGEVAIPFTASGLPLEFS